MTQYKIGQGQIRKLMIKSDKTSLEVNLSNIVTFISYYEDLFSPFMSCDIQVADGTSLHTVLPIVGGETVSIDIGEVGGKRKLKTDMVVYKISSRQRSTQDVDSYRLNLTTKEQLTDSTISINRSYTKKLSETLKDVVEEFITPVTGKKLITNEESKGIQTIISTGLSPLAFIKQIGREAESPKNPSSLYFFYETVEGYHFQTMDEMYSKKESHNYVRDTIVDSPANPGVSNKLQYNISHIQVDEFPGISELQQNGLSSVTYSFDPLTKNYTTTVNDYTKEFKPQSRDQSYFTDKTRQQYLSKPTKAQFVIHNSHHLDNRKISYISGRDPNTEIDFRTRQTFVAREQMTKHQYGSTRIHISVPGNPHIIVGQTINVIIPRADDTTTGTPLNEKYMSGKYIVSAVKHVFDTNRGKFESVCECLRRSFENTP